MLGASALALMGFGMPGEMAQIIGADYKLFNGTGTSQVGATIITAQNAEIVVSGGATALILGPTNSGGAPLIMDDYWVTNQTSTAVTALIFVPVGHNLNGSLNASLSLAQFKSAVLWQYKLKNWTYVLTA